ncbi:MAG: PAS domain S-box protein [Nitrospirales bacterium]|nr:PAS domain S-box protein [Nitrospirales bacterium]
MERKEATWISDITQDPNFPRAHMADELGIRGGFAFPVIMGNAVMSVLEFFSRSVEHPIPDCWTSWKLSNATRTGLGTQTRGIGSGGKRCANTCTVDTAAPMPSSPSMSGIIQSFNHAAQQVFGYSTQEAIGRNVSLLMPSPYQENHDSYLQRYLADTLSSIFGTNRELGRSTKRWDRISHGTGRQ